MTRPPHSCQRAYTLLEMTLAVAVATVLLGGLGTAVILASRAVPDPDSPTGTTAEAYHVVEQIAGELFCAESFTARSSTLVEFTVANRDRPCPCDVNPLCHPSCAPETIRYAWSGTAGDPLTRKYNANAALNVVDDVRDFAFAYDFDTMTKTTTETVSTWSAEQLLASFDGWTGVTPGMKDQVVGGSNIVSEYFEVSPPSGATQLKFTMARVTLRRGTTVPAYLTVGIHRSLNDGSYKPATAPIGTPGVIPGTSLLTSALSIDALLSDAIVTDLTRTDYCLVIGGEASSIGYVQYLYSTSAPADVTCMRWSTDAGATWSPNTSKLNQQDVRFYVYGASLSETTQDVTTHRYFITSMKIALRIGSDPSSRVDTTVQILNGPEVASP